MTSDIIAAETEELKLREDRVLQYKEDLGTNAWDLGAELAYIKEKRLFSVKSPLWEHYVEEYLDISRRSADMFIRLARNYSRKLVSDWGIKKANLMLTLTEGERAEVLKDIEPAEVTHKELEAAIRPLKKQRVDRENSAEKCSEVDLEEKVRQKKLEHLRSTITLGEEILQDFSKVNIKLQEYRYMIDGCRAQDAWNSDLDECRRIEELERLHFKEADNLRGECGK